MDTTELMGALEAVLFASGNPLSFAELKKIFERHGTATVSERDAASDVSTATVSERDAELTQGELFPDGYAVEPVPAEEAQTSETSLEPVPHTPPTLTTTLRAALRALLQKWEPLNHQSGFELIEVAEGYTFRTCARYGAVLRAMREDQKPVRLSRPALETLAIIAYRQPVTKPEADHIRGVDCGGTLKVLLDRNLVRIVGKKEEPGRPLLYGTTREFLSLFNLGALNHLPSLRDFKELNDESADELRAFDGLNLRELSESAKALQLGEEPALSALDEAVTQLANTETTARLAFAGEGIRLTSAEEAEANANRLAGASAASAASPAQPTSSTSPTPSE